MLTQKLSTADLPEPKRSNATNDFYDCPFCNDTRGRLGVLRTRGIFHCFNCQASGRLRDLPLLDRFQEKVKFKLYGKDYFKIMNKPLGLPMGFRRIEEGTMAHRYLKKRGITQQEIVRYELGYTPTGLFANRIIIPIRRGLILKYFLGRTYLNENPKYMNAAVPKEDLVFKTFEGKVKEVVICEGAFDAISIGHVKPAISLLGKTMSDAQLETIKKSTDTVIIMLDPDAKVDAFKLYSRIQYHMKSTLVFLSTKDPGEMSVKQIKEILK